MRDALLPLKRGEYPDHAGLCCELAAPLKPDEGKVDEERAGRWYQHMEGLRASRAYELAQGRWRASLARDQAAGRGCLFEVAAVGRLLVGHGNAAPSGVGLTVSRTFGMPLVPGSALKGLAAHYAHVVYGPDEGEQDPRRLAWAGPCWEGRRLKSPPGAEYAKVFGAPAREAQQEDGGGAGQVEFHDAWYVPDAQAIFARDVLTVHQRGYYGGQGAPNDHESPNPVSFLSVRPGTRFLIGVTLRAAGQAGGQEVLRGAQRLLEEALDNWGVGGKTSSGYGRLLAQKAR